MSKDKEGTLIPFIKEKGTRDIVQSQFETAESKKKRLIDTFNEVIKEELTPVSKETHTPEQSTLDTEALEKEYRRKKDEQKKKREENNRDVTRIYNLRHPSSKDRKK